MLEINSTTEENDSRIFRINSGAELAPGKIRGVLKRVLIDEEKETPRIYFEFELDINGHLILKRQHFFYSINPDSLYVKFLTDICKTMGLEGLDFRDIIEVWGTVEIENVNHEDGRIFSNVVRFVPYMDDVQDNMHTID